MDIICVLSLRQAHAYGQNAVECISNINMKSEVAKAFKFKYTAITTCTLSCTPSGKYLEDQRHLDHFFQISLLIAITMLTMHSYSFSSMTRPYHDGKTYSKISVLDMQ